MRDRARATVVVCSSLLALCLVLAACPKKEAPGGEPAKDPAAKGTEPAKPKAAAPAPANKEMDAAVRKVAAELSGKKCTESSTNRCAGYDETAKMLDAPGKELDAVKTLAALINDKDPAVRHVAGFLFYGSARRRAFVRHADAITPALAEQMVAGLGQLAGYAAARTAKPAAWAASMTGKLDTLSKVVEGHANKNVARMAVENMMAFGRLKGFDKVQAYAKGDKPQLVTAALKAPMNMYKWTDDERTKLCPWAQSFLPHAELLAATQAAHLMNRCKQDGKYIEALLAEGQRRVDAGLWQMPYDFPFRDVCFGGFFGTDKQAAQELCDKNYAFLLSITNNKKVDAKMRARALDWIVYQRRDEKSYKLLKKYRKHKVAEIAKVAVDGMAMLERSYLKKKK